MSDVTRNIDSAYSSSKKFLPFVTEIRFPEYKSLEKDFRLTLDWPVVALVGPNGTNKSSILQAMASTPEGRSLSSYWFSTPVDDIDSHTQSQKKKHRFIYKYRFDRGDILAECRKMRIKKKYRGSDLPKDLVGLDDPDYWEPTRPVDSDRMSKIPSTGFDRLLSPSRDRWNLIEKPVLFIDFRAELSAFDKYINHVPYDRWAKDDTHKRYRAVAKSSKIARALDGEKLNAAESKKVIRSVRHLGEESTKAVSNILGKNIEDVKILEHEFFGTPGVTIKIKVAGMARSYSEAHAGSGEYGVVRLVDYIQSAEKASLILLDEPEISLHPIAQKRMMQFIMETCLDKGHQVVFSTHSPFMVEDLPNKAIKLLGLDSARQEVRLVATGCTPREAFFRLSEVDVNTTQLANQTKIIVEDELAAHLVDSAARRRPGVHGGPGRPGSIKIIAVPGGAGSIVRGVFSSAAVTNDSSYKFVLDGDQDPVRTSQSAPESLSEPEGTVDDSCLDLDSLGDRGLEAFWKRNFCSSTPDVYLNSGEKGSSVGANKWRSVIDFATTSLSYLPGLTPEELLIKALPSSLALEAVWPDDEGTADWKDIWVAFYRLSRKLGPEENVSASDIYQFQVAMSYDVPDGHLMYLDILDVLDELDVW